MANTATVSKQAGLPKATPEQRAELAALNQTRQACHERLQSGDSPLGYLALKQEEAKKTASEQAIAALLQTADFS